MPTGINTYIIKLASICNLNCSYCYYFNGADNSYRGRPKLISQEIIRLMVDKIIAHTSKHGITNIDLSLHGGEPLLIDKESFVEMMYEFNRIDQAGVTTRRKIQTNAVLLDDIWIKLLTEWNIRLGVSMDGPKEVHDEFRVDHAGRGSYDRTIRNLKMALANEAEGLRTSVLSVINPAHSGTEMYHHLRALGVKKMDFLLPENNYAHPPMNFVPLGEATPFGDFLLDVLDAWLTEDNPEVKVRILDEVISSFMINDVMSDAIGTAPVRVAVIETDGSLEPTDNFKACSNNMTNLGLSIFEHDFDDLYYHKFFEHCIDAAQYTPTPCQTCEYLDICGGGRITTRYSEDHGEEGAFRNRTIYCHDLLKVFGHVGRLVNEVLETPEEVPVVA